MIRVTNRVANQGEIAKRQEIRRIESPAGQERRMYELSKELLDRKIGRRSFINRLAQAGLSVAGAGVIADNLGASESSSSTPEFTSPEKGRLVNGMTGGEVMAEFLLDWDIPYIFGLAGSEEVGLLDALVDRPDLKYTTCLHENAAMAMADGYSRSTGETSIVQLHSVAGVAYALGQLAGSYRCRTPVHRFSRPHGVPRVAESGGNASRLRAMGMGCHEPGNDSGSIAPCVPAGRGAAGRADIRHFFQGLVGTAYRFGRDRAAFAIPGG
jgi:hypothetical protein